MTLDRIVHVVAPEDWPGVVARYVALLGPPPHEVDGLAVFEAGEVRIVVEARVDEPCPDQGGDRLAWTVSELEREVDRLRAAGWCLEYGPEQTWWGRAALLRDPTGTQVELVEDERCGNGD